VPALDVGWHCVLDVDEAVQAGGSPRSARGSRFVRWSGACRGATSSCVLRMAAPATAVAVFAKTRP
jgi:hypothetical protein